MFKKTILFVCVLALVSASAFAAVKTYQVTGPVLEVKSDMIVVQKGNDRWEIARDAATKVTGDLKVGEKVTIEYRMTAASIETKVVAKKVTASEKKETKATEKKETKTTTKKH